MTPVTSIWVVHISTHDTSPILDHSNQLDRGQGCCFAAWPLGQKLASARELCLHDISTLWRCALRLVKKGPPFNRFTMVSCAYWSPVTINIGRENRQHAQVGRLPFPWSKYSNISTITITIDPKYSNRIQLVMVQWFKSPHVPMSSQGHGDVSQLLATHLAGGLAINIFPIFGGKNQTVNFHDIPKSPFLLSIFHMIRNYWPLHFSEMRQRWSSFHMWATASIVQARHGWRSAKSAETDWKPGVFSHVWILSCRFSLPIQWKTSRKDTSHLSKLWQENHLDIFLFRQFFGTGFVQSSMVDGKVIYLIHQGSTPVLAVPVPSWKPSCPICA